MSLKYWLEEQKEYRRGKKEFFQKAKDWEINGFVTPVFRMLGQNIAFPCSSPKQFYRACVIIRKLTAASDRAARKAEKLEAQLWKIHKLHDQLQNGVSVKPYSVPSKASTISHTPE